MAVVPISSVHPRPLANAPRCALSAAMPRCGVLRVEPRSESRRMRVSGGRAGEAENEGEGEGGGAPLRTERRRWHSWASTTWAGVQLGAETSPSPAPPVVDVEKDVVECEEGEDGPALSGEDELARA